MPHRPTQRVSTQSPSPSPSRPQESQVEVLYNTSVQSFVRRDHVKTQATLARLIELLNTDRSKPRRVWYDFASNPESKAVEAQAGNDAENDDWMIKTLKLLISSTASLYTDPPAKTQALPELIVTLLPPSSPKEILSYLRHRCVTAYYGSSILPSAHLVPPPLMSTLILASLKLSPNLPSLDFAHHLTEDWLADLPDSFFFSIVPSGTRHPSKSPLEKKRIESAREGYLKVVELFVGEVLAREGEWEMARAFLEGEAAMGSKKKEASYRRLRTLQNKPARVLPAPSPSSSLILPATTPTLPSPPPTPSGSATPSNKNRSGSTSSASSSSSEATARPKVGQLGQLGGQGLTMSQRIAKLRDERENGRKGSSEGEGSGVPQTTSRASQAGSTGESPRGSQSRPATGSTNTVQKVTNSLLRRLPLSASSYLQSLSSSHLLIPLPVIFLILAYMRLRRRRRRQQNVHLARNVSTSQVQARLNRARALQTGWAQWVWYYVRWWIAKFGGVWKLGTTITYV